MFTDAELGYLAGLLDGEGSIYISCRNEGGYKNYFARFQIVNTNFDVMHWIKNKFGGLLFVRERSKTNPRWKDSMEWFTNVKELDSLLPLLIPYLIIKKPHALIMQEFRKTFTGKAGGKRTSPKLRTVRAEYYDKLKKLNRRGPISSSPVSPSP